MEFVDPPIDVTLNSNPLFVYNRLNGNTIAQLIRQRGIAYLWLTYTEFKCLFSIQNFKFYAIFLSLQGMRLTKSTINEKPLEIFEWMQFLWKHCFDYSSYVVRLIKKLFASYPVGSNENRLKIFFRGYLFKSGSAEIFFGEFNFYAFILTRRKLRGIQHRKICSEAYWDGFSFCRVCSDVEPSWQSGSLISWACLSEIVLYVAIACDTIELTSPKKQRDSYLWPSFLLQTYHSPALVGRINVLPVFARFPNALT